MQERKLIILAIVGLVVVASMLISIFGFLMLLNFSSICDMGAYFTGTMLGKHKLCPNISPKKTVEGAVGGIVWSLIITVALCFGFSFSEKRALPVLHLLRKTSRKV